MMASIVKQERLDEGQTLAQLDKILNLEREIKRAHFTLIVRLKNALTPEQQTRLQEIKRKSGNKLRRLSHWVIEDWCAKEPL